jgi:hypothetical protein
VKKKRIRRLVERDQEKRERGGERLDLAIEKINREELGFCRRAFGLVGAKRVLLGHAGLDTELGLKAAESEGTR